MSETGAALESIDITRLLQLLPHRYPFLLIDKIVDIDGDRSATGIKNVTMNEPHFQGHFPGHPVMPGVLIVEAMAQTAGAICLNKMDTGTTALVFFMTIDNAKFRRPVVPGDQLRIEVVPLRKGKIFKMKGEITVDGNVVSSAEFLAGLAEKSKVQ